MRFTWIHPLKAKSNVKIVLPSFIKLIENQFALKLRLLRSNNGKKFILNEFYSTNGIFHKTTYVETPQQNNIVERKHQHLLNVSRALLFQAHLSNCFWSFVVKHATHIINRLPSSSLNFKSPYELVHGHSPVLNHLRIFGCFAYATTIAAGRTKLDKRALKTIFLGFKPGTKSFVLYDLSHKSCFISRNVIFYEQHFSFSTHSHIANTNVIQHDNIFFDSLLPFDSNALQLLPATPVTANPESLPEALAQITESSTRNSHRIKKPPAYLADYHCPTIASSHATSSTPYPLHSYLSYSNCSIAHTAFCLNRFCTFELTSSKEANQIDYWKIAMLAKLQALQRNQTWSLVSLP